MSEGERADDEQMQRLADKQVATHEALRRLGFPAGDIYVLVSPDSGLVRTLLRTQGKEWVCAYPGAPAVDPRRYEAFWTRTAEDFNAGRRDGEAVYRENVSENVLLMMATSLRQAGFVLPALAKASKGGRDGG